MKYYLILVLLYSTHTFSRINECHRQISQADKNECMAYERDMAVGQLMTEVTKKCAEKDEVRESKGGSIYPMLLDECMTKELLKLSREVDSD